MLIYMLEILYIWMTCPALALPHDLYAAGAPRGGKYSSTSQYYIKSLFSSQNCSRATVTLNV